MFAYRLDVLTEDQISGQDPFAGSGLRLPFPEGLGQEEAESKLRETFGAVPYVAFSSHAWLDLPAGLSPEAAGDLWQRSTSCYRL